MCYGRQKQNSGGTRKYVKLVGYRRTSKQDKRIPSGTQVLLQGIIMKRFFLGCFVLFVGCEQSQVVSTCVPNTSAKAPIVVVPANQPCVDRAECASDECVPIVNPAMGFEGVCWDSEFLGCEDVAFDAWIISEFCGTRVLRVCQVDLTPEQDAQCDPPVDSLAPWIASFQCCDP